MLVFEVHSTHRAGPPGASSLAIATDAVEASG